MVVSERGIRDRLELQGCQKVVRRRAVRSRMAVERVRKTKLFV